MGDNRISMDRTSLRRIAVDTGGDTGELWLFFIGEDERHVIEVDDSDIASQIYSDVVDSSEDIAWEQLEDDIPWRRNGVQVESEA